MTTTEPKIIIYVDMDDTLCDFKEAFYRYRQTHPDIKFPQSIPNFFCALAPLPDAIETFQWLSAQPQLDVFILTAPSVKNPLCYTEKRLWIEAHLGFEATKQLVISRHKHLQKGHFLIDDQVTGRGQDRFDGTVMHFGSSAFPNWRSVRDHFELLIEQDQLPSLMEKTLLKIMCFQVFDMRHHFDEPIATFRGVLEQLQSERAYYPAAMSDVVCFLRNGQSMPIPESFYLVKKCRFNSRWEAEKWVLERAEKIMKNGKFWGLMGLAIADPKLPIDAQIEKALAYIDTKVIDAAENDRVCAELDVWLSSAIRALPKVIKQDVPGQTGALDTTKVLTPSAALVREEVSSQIPQDDHPLEKPFKVEFDRQLIACHEDSHTYLYETISPFSDFTTLAVLHLHHPERFTLDKNDCGVEQLAVDIRPEAMDDLAIAWCKHRKLQGALGGPVGREWGSPDCEYD